MSRRAAPQDPRQGCLLFAPPAAPPALAGSSNVGRELRAALSKAIETCPHSRAEIAARMTEALFAEGEDGEVTLSQINAWTAASKDGWRFPLEYLPAFVGATGAVWLVDWIAQRAGCRALRGEQAVLVELSAKKLLQRRREEEVKALKQEVEALEAGVPLTILDGLGGPEAGQ